MTAMPQPLTVTAVPAAALAAMDPDDFAAIVRTSLGAGPDVWDALTDPAVINRTKECLTALHVDVQNQLTLANAQLEQIHAEGRKRGEAGKQAYLAAKEEQAEWRRKALGFRRLLQQRLSLVKSRTPRPPAQPTMPFGPGGTKNARKHNRQALELLARAVAEHRRKVLSGEGGEEDDDALWDRLGSITAITAGGGELSLAEWLDYLDDLRDEDDDERG